MPSLTWLTRDEDLKRAAAVPYRLLEADPALSHGDAAAGNMLIQGDNLDALKALLPYYKGRVKCIYIDPPYNTRSAFEHYDDNLEHTQWLAMIYPRLELLRDLLAEDGEGAVLAVIAPNASDEVKREIAKAVETIAPGAIEAVERNIVQTEAAKSPAARGVPFAVPQLQIMVQGELDLAYPESFIDLAGWDLLAHGPDLPGFNFIEQPDSYEFDIEGDHLVYQHVATTLELALDGATNWDEAALARFLDRQTRQAHKATGFSQFWR